jgi:hypothetical protein
MSEARFPLGRWSKPKEPAFNDSATAHYDRTDPGQSTPDECTHSYVRIGSSNKNRWLCPHCRKKFDFGEDGRI